MPRLPTRGEDSYLPAIVDASGYQTSLILEAHYRLERRMRPTGYWDYELVEAAAS